MKKSQLHNINTTGFKIPSEYMESLDERILAKLSAQDNLSSVRAPGFKVPENYFENFDARLSQQLSKEQHPKVRMLWTRRNFMMASGIAASLMIFLTVLLNTEKQTSFQNLETASIERYLNDENLSSYDILSVLNMDDLQMDDFVSNTIPVESLESYLLDNATIEDIINSK